jgi:hypothetical protein
VVSQNPSAGNYVLCALNRTPSPAAEAGREEPAEPYPTGVRFPQMGLLILILVVLSPCIIALLLFIFRGRR